MWFEGIAVAFAGAGLCWAGFGMDFVFILVVWSPLAHALTHSLSPPIRVGTNFELYKYSKATLDCHQFGSSPCDLNNYSAAPPSFLTSGLKYSYHEGRR